MANKLKIISSDEEALFNANPIYYVQSPSVFSHETPVRIQNPSNNTTLEAYGLVLSRYSSSHGSTNSFLNENIKASLHEEQVIGEGFTNMEDLNKYGRIIDDMIEKRNYLQEDEEDEDDEKDGFWSWQLLTFSQSSSCGWKFVQISWRFLVSIAIALLVFYVLTKPPPPVLSVKVARIDQFELSEGVDGSGVTTKLVTCNFTINIVINNKSKLFALYIHSPTTQMAFSQLPFAYSQGRNLQAEANGLTKMKIFLDTRNKAMYSVGRSMQELLDSNNGLPLAIHVSLRSSFHMVWGLIKPKYHHQFHCLVILFSQYDDVYTKLTENYNTTCKSL